MESLHLVVGLGNPGAEYARTRHNAGFLVLEELARRASAGWNLERKFDARVAKLDQKARKVLLAQPQTFMNLSGEAVSALAGFYRVPLNQLLVVTDDGAGIDVESRGSWPAITSSWAATSSTVRPNGPG